MDLAKSMHADPRAALRPFFSKIDTKGAAHVKGFQDDVDAFVVKLCKRAVDKKKEMEEEAAKAPEAGEEEEEYVELSKEERVAQAPGGLDPLDVFESLPDVMKEAFSEQDIPKLHKAIEAMDAEEAKYHIDRCVKSGLWVPS
jgi:cell division cycle protein 37